MTRDDLEPYALFTTNGTDVWRLQQYCLEPTCELRNIETGERRDFGLGGLTAQSFTRIQMPVGHYPTCAGADMAPELYPGERN